MGFWFTIIGALFKVICDLLLGMGVTGESAEFAQSFCTWLGIILTGIGIIKSLIVGEGWSEKLFCVVIHVIIWVVVFVGMSFLLPFIILFVALFVVDFVFLGGRITAFIHDWFAGIGANGGVSWPVYIYDWANQEYRIDVDLGDTAVYKCDSNGDSITVSKSDVDGRYINTMVGQFHY